MSDWDECAAEYSSPSSTPDFPGVSCDDDSALECNYGD